MAEPTSDERAEGPPSELDEPNLPAHEVKEEGDAQDHQETDEDGRHGAEENAEPDDSKLGEAEQQADGAEDPAASQEEYREEILEKYGDDEGQVEDKPAQEARASTDEDGAESQPPSNREDVEDSTEGAAGLEESLQETPEKHDQGDVNPGRESKDDESIEAEGSVKEELGAATEQDGQTESNEAQVPEQEGRVNDVEGETAPPASDALKSLTPDEEAETVPDSNENPGVPGGSVTQLDQEAPEGAADNSRYQPELSFPSEIEGGSSDAAEPKAEVVATVPSEDGPAGQQERQVSDPSASKGDDFGARTQSELVGSQDLERYDFKLDDIEPKEKESDWDQDPRFFEAIEHSRGPMLRIPDSDLERAGADVSEMENRDIVELTVRDVSDDGVDIRTVFGRYDAEYGRAEVYLGRSGAYEDHEFQPLMASRYSEEQIVRDFNEHKCEHLGNLNLEFEEGKAFLDVDGRSVPFEERRMSTNGSEVVLRGKLDDEADFKVSFDGSRGTARFGGSSVVESMRVEDDELLVKYAMSKNDKRTWKMSLDETQDAEKRDLHSLLTNENLSEAVRLTSIPETPEGDYGFEVDPSFQKSVAEALDNARETGDNELRTTRARISETIVPHLLERAGWEHLQDHPGTRIRRGDSVHFNGPDGLDVSPLGELSSTENKWHNDARLADRKAAKQLTNPSYQDIRHDGEMVSCGYSQVLDWDSDARTGIIRVRRVWANN